MTTIKRLNISGNNFIITEDENGNYTEWNEITKIKNHIKAITEVLQDDKQNGGNCIVNIKWLLKELLELSN